LNTYRQPESNPSHASNNVLGAENIFIEEGAKVEFATLNASTGLSI
jgi:hypothetical protein